MCRPGRGWSDNAGESECGTDPDHPDTDGDGILDGDESCTDDSDDDGIIDALDPTDDDGEGGGLAPRGQGPYGFSGGDFTGGSCSTLPPVALLAPAMLAFIAVSSRRRRRPGILLTIGAAAVGPRALAQELNADRLRPAIGQATLLTTDDTDRPARAGKPASACADDPLVYRYSDGRPEVPVLERPGTMRAMPWWSRGPAWLDWRCRCTSWPRHAA